VAVDTNPELRITITGTGCPIPDALRAGPGVLVQFGELAMQFDVGRSTVQRLAGAGLWPGELDAVFLTHHHSDHMVGLPDLVLTRWVIDRARSATPLPVIAPAGPALVFAQRMLDAWADDIAVRAEHTGRSDRPEPGVVSFAASTSIGEVLRAATPHGEVAVSAIAVHHEPVSPSVGYRVDTPAGSVAISGDTVVCSEMALLADGVDVLVYEAMRFEPIEALPENRRFILDYHADTRLIGVQAAELDVPTLVLTHLIPPPADDSDKSKFVSDVRAAGYTGKVIVADDLDVVSVGV